MISPKPLQCEDEFLEGHEQSSRRSQVEKTETEANRNRHGLSTNCTQINELQMIERQ
jgi:hypothetical protein